jgi:predicted metal-dependent phosphoesterase TrpH
MKPHAMYHDRNGRTGRATETMRVDLHTHTTASDGVLSPRDLVAAATAADIDMLAVTDHDSVAGYREIAALQSTGIKLVSGTEISCYWRKRCIHIVGLGIDIDAPVLVAGLAAQRAARAERAVEIAARLAKAGFSDTLADTQRIAGNAAIGRLHFAKHLVERGAAKDYATAFKKYLGTGKPGDVKSAWIDMAGGIEWITQAGGAAVLAHPAKYKLTHRKLEELVSDFASAGGHALEVVSGTQVAGLTDRLARLAGRRGLRASSGSDFHRPGQQWAALGAQPALPASCEPVWDEWI